jgi:hypothetical protein
MDGLDRQPDENFHVWARRIQNVLIGLEGKQPYPRSYQLVEEYIGRIRQQSPRPPLLYIIRCICGQRIQCGIDGLSKDELFNLHGYICPGNINVRRTITLQKIFRGYITRKKLKAAKIIRQAEAVKIIQQAVFPWLYRPGGPLMQKAEKRFNRLVELQRM